MEHFLLNSAIILLHVLLYICENLRTFFLKISFLLFNIAYSPTLQLNLSCCFFFLHDTGHIHHRDTPETTPPHPPQYVSVMPNPNPPLHHVLQTWTTDFIEIHQRRQHFSNRQLYIFSVPKFILTGVEVHICSLTNDNSHTFSKAHPLRQCMLTDESTVGNY